jgi:YesN/AraC family two-component response regulator
VVKDMGSNFIGIGFIPEFFSQIGINKKHADAFTLFSSQNNPHFQLNDEDAAILEQLMLLLYNKDRSSPEHPFKEELIYHAFNLLIIELIAISRKHRKVHDFKLSRKQEILMSFLKILPNYFKEERSVQFYANLLFITPKHLTKTVKELTNKTCGELIDDMVIIEAKVLLTTPSLSVGNVAEMLHFSDQFFFSKFFKRRTGLTPTEFRSGK